MMEPLTHLLHRLRRLAPEPASDAALLARFVRGRDEAAFTALVERHGPMVLHTCRRVLGDAHAAEDAFQAAFLVLARKADAIGRPEALAGWLHGVACRIARKARGAIRSLPGLAEAPEPLDPRPDPLAVVSARELLAVLDEEVRRLPEVYRLPVLLCCLEGLSQEEAARRLGWSPGSVKGRLERGRARLQARLRRRGLSLVVALAGVEASKGTSAACLSASLMDATVRSALAFFAGAGSSSRVVALAEGALQAMFMSKLKSSAMVLAVVGLLGAGVVWLGNGPGNNTPSTAPAAHAAEPGVKGRPSREAERGGGGRRLEQARDELHNIAAEAEERDRKLSDEIVEARQRMVELEEQQRALDAAGLPGPTQEEASLRKEAAALEDAILKVKQMANLSETKLKEPKQLVQTQKTLVEIREQIDKRERVRVDVRQERTRDRINLRKKIVRLDEDILQLERKRADQRQEAARRKENAAERVRLLEGRSAAAPPPERSLRAVERGLDAVQRELSELRREVQRLRADRKR